MSEVSSDDSVKTIVDMIENKRHSNLESEENGSDLIFSEDARNIIELGHEKADPHGDLLNLEVDLSLKEIIDSVESKVGDSPKSGDPPNYNNFDKSEINLIAVSSDEEQEDMKPLDTEKNYSFKQTINACCNSEEDILILNESKYIISNNVSEKNIELDHETAKPHGDLLNLDLSLNEVIDSVELKVVGRPKSGDPPNYDNFDKSEINLIAVSSDEEQEDIKPLDTEKNYSFKQTINACCNSEEDILILNKSKYIVSNNVSEKNITITYNHYTKMRGLSKYSIAHKIFSKSNAKSYTGHSTPRSPNSGEKYKKFLSKTCSRNKIGESRYRREYKLRKYSSEDYFTSDSKDLFQSSSFSDSELSSIDSDYYDHTKYLNSIPKHAVTVENDNVSSRKNRSKKRTKSQYERKRFSMSSSASDSSNSVQEISFGKKHDKEKAYKNNTEKKRLKGLIGRQVDLINEQILRKDELVPVQYSFSTSNYAKKCKEKSDLSEEDFKGKIIALEENTLGKNLKKRKNRGFEQDPTPCKVAKTRNHLDHISRDKRNTESYKPKLRSIVGSSSSPSPISPVETKRRHKRGKETSYSSTQTLRNHTREKNETKFRNFDNKRSDETCSDVIQENGNENDEECYDANGLNAVKDIGSYFLFLSKKRGKHTNVELLLEEPAENISHEKLSVITTPKIKYREDYFDNREAENASIQKNQKFTESNSVFSENVARKLKKTTCVPQAAFEKKKQSSTKKTTEMPEEGKRNVSSRRKHTNELPLKKTAKNISYEKLSVNTAPKPKYREKYLDDREAENASIQKITRNDSENVAGKLKKSTCVPQAASKKKKQNSIEKTATKMPAEGRDVSSSLQLFMKLNREIGKKKVTKGYNEHK